VKLELDNVTQENIEELIEVVKTFSSLPLKRLELEGKTGKIIAYKLGDIVRIDVAFSKEAA
jgi:predicted regulator of Ras-like GTPase activity (Roadblock/LC7/MglB family)